MLRTWDYVSIFILLLGVFTIVFATYLYFHYRMKNGQAIRFNVNPMSRIKRPANLRLNKKKMGQRRRSCTPTIQILDQHQAWPGTPIVTYLDKGKVLSLEEALGSPPTATPKPKRLSRVPVPYPKGSPADPEKIKGKHESLPPIPMPPYLTMSKRSKSQNPEPSPSDLENGLHQKSLPGTPLTIVDMEKLVRPDDQPPVPAIPADNDQTTARSSQPEALPLMSPPLMSPSKALLGEPASPTKSKRASKRESMNKPLPPTPQPRGGHKCHQHSHPPPTSPLGPPGHLLASSIPEDSSVDENDTASNCSCESCSNSLNSHESVPSRISHASSDGVSKHSETLSQENDESNSISPASAASSDSINFRISSSPPRGRYSEQRWVPEHLRSKPVPGLPTRDSADPVRDGAPPPRHPSRDAPVPRPLSIARNKRTYSRESAVAEACAKANSSSSPVRESVTPPKTPPPASEAGSRHSTVRGFPSNGPPTPSWALASHPISPTREPPAPPRQVSVAISAATAADSSVDPEPPSPLNEMDTHPALRRNYVHSPVSTESEMGFWKGSYFQNYPSPA